MNLFELFYSKRPEYRRLILVYFLSILLLGGLLSFLSFVSPYYVFSGYPSYEAFFVLGVPFILLAALLLSFLSERLMLKDGRMYAPRDYSLAKSFVLTMRMIVSLIVEKSSFLAKVCLAYPFATILYITSQYVANESFDINRMVFLIPPFAFVIVMAVLFSYLEVNITTPARVDEKR